MCPPSRHLALSCHPLAYVAAVGTVSAAGLSLDALRDSLFQTHSGALTRTSRFSKSALAYGLCPDFDVAAHAHTRTQALLAQCLSQMPQLAAVIANVGAHRVAVILGASVSGMPETEEAMRVHHRCGALPEHFDIRALNLYEPARWVADTLGLTGPAWTLSNACASGAMAIITGVRLLARSLADAVIVGGVDAASGFTTAGFQALGAVSPEPCRPFDAHRHGINLGEGGALCLLTRTRPLDLPECPVILGYGESTDAHHISAPDPTGAGAVASMQAALAMAQLPAQAVDLVSAHGTATELNDAMEARACSRVFAADVPLASYKALSGHTLAGAGALQAAIAAALLTDNPEGILPAMDLQEPDARLADLPVDFLTQTRRRGRALTAVMTNAFAFGGSNASVLYGAVRHNPTDLVKAHD